MLVFARHSRHQAGQWRHENAATERLGKERLPLRRHPWIFESAIAKGGADAGETVRVESHKGEFLAWASVSPASKIRARAWSFDEKQRIDAAFLAAKVATAIRARARFDIQSDSDAPGARRVGRPAGPDRRPLRRHAGGAVPVRWRRALEAGAGRRAAEGNRAHAPVRTLGHQLAVAGRTGRSQRLAARRRPYRTHDPRARLEAEPGHCRRPQDRLLPGPARQPAQVRGPCEAARLPAGAQLLLLHRRVHRRGAPGAVPAM